ncbi:anhydro-N-acetylmuramic acid kinase [Paenibacillus castaneae]|uniref:anhydro-N-acetylmuramic acid kinase n=1 Tax=Paenibacillus castaneae TaxID=474957 RepID=UPI000C9C0E09|nr:anhydro-N-acetylmuramic acid kinase [Paenibacillus castaneae]NIK75806.1 anhydro-N-acetylmuramic acid kinase [Paenibacillus castaneae]
MSTVSVNNCRYVVGLMSGTSVDGIDAAVVQISGSLGDRPEVKLIAFENTPYPKSVREKLFSLFDPSKATVDRVGRMNVWLGELYAKSALSVIAKAGLQASDIAVIGSHGQTIYHAPENEYIDGYDLHYTVQIGEGAIISARTGVPCVSDFRVADMAVGGQGAPLVPFTEYLLYREDNRSLLLQNIGGIGNITVIPAGAAPEQVFAFDTGPGNMLIDGVVASLYAGEKTMDAGGAIAQKGQVNIALFHLLQQEAYYKLPLPKSTGRERFGASYVDWLLSYQRENNLPPNDLIATVTKLTAWSIGEAYRRFIRESSPSNVMIVGGGGCYNPVLIRFLQEEMEPMGVQVLTQEEVGGNSDAKEAVAFALLADYTLSRMPNNLPNVTGAQRSVIMGKISY